MTQLNANSSSWNPQLPRSIPQDRCRHTSPTGRRCRTPAGTSAGFCAKHEHEQAAEVAAALTANLDDLSSPEQINTFLSRLLLLLAQDKISARRAAVLTYIASQLLRSVHTMIAEEKRGGTIILDMQHPESAPDDAHDTASVTGQEEVPA